MLFFAWFLPDIKCLRSENSDPIDGRATNEDLRLTELPSGQISTSGEVILCFNEGERQFLAHEDGVFLLESL